MRLAVLGAALLAGSATAQILAPWDSINDDARRAVIGAASDGGMVNRVHVSSVYFYRLLGFGHVDGDSGDLSCGAAELRSMDDGTAAFIVMYVLGSDGNVLRVGSPALSDVRTTSWLDDRIADYCQQVAKQIRQGTATLVAVVGYE
jgi:hypothetical protein